MKVYNSNEVIDVQMDFSCINFDDVIDNDDSSMISYENRGFLTVIKSLIDDVVSEAGTSWQEPDYKKSKTYFYISRGEVNLSIEVFPKRYSAKEKQAMIEASSKQERENGWSEEQELMNMFDDIDEILNCSYPVGEVSVYPLELTQDEKEALFAIVK